MNFKYIIIIIFTFTLSLRGQINNDSIIKGLDGKEINKIALENDLKTIMEDLNIQAISIAIINNTNVVYNKNLGITNTETNKEVTENTMFEAASLSKPVFAYFVMKMVEKGKLDLDKSMFTYFPHPAIEDKFIENYKKITPRMVLSHSTGFPNWSEGKKIILAHEPGNGFSYSGEAYQYLAAVIGSQNGVGYKDDLNEIFLKEVAKPLNLDHTSFTWNSYLQSHKAYGHQDGKPTDNQSQGKNFGAAYSLHSNASDYSKFLIAMMNQKGLDQEYFEEMLDEQNHFNEENELYKNLGQTGWGLGFAQKKTKDYTMHLHTGNNHDFQSYCMFIPDLGYGIVVFMNTNKMESFLERLTNSLGKQF